jgi:hypothetical protein
VDTVSQRRNVLSSVRFAKDVEISETWWKHTWKSYKLRNKKHGLKKGWFFSAALRPILWSEERFRRTLKNFSVEVNYLVLGGDKHIFYKVAFPRIFLQDQFKQRVLVLRFLWFLLATEHTSWPPCNFFVRVIFLISDEEQLFSALRRLSCKNVIAMEKWPRLQLGSDGTSVTGSVLKMFWKRVQIAPKTTQWILWTMDNFAPRTVFVERSSTKEHYHQPHPPFGKQMQALKRVLTHIRAFKICIKNRKVAKQIWDNWNLTTTLHTFWSHWLEPLFRGRIFSPNQVVKFKHSQETIGSPSTGAIANRWKYPLAQYKSV